MDEIVTVFVGVENSDSLLFQSRDLFSIGIDTKTRIDKLFLVLVSVTTPIESFSLDSWHFLWLAVPAQLTRSVQPC